MKGVFMFDQLNDLVFSKIDVLLSKHLRQLAVKDQLIEENFDDSNINIDKDVIVQVFSPLLASYKVMLHQFGQTYQCIEMKDRTFIVFKKILNFIVMSISSSEHNQTLMIQKELSMFLMFTKMLYGPALHLISTNNFQHNERAKLLSQLIDDWLHLHNDCQMFLVEAVEKLIVNPSIASLSVNLLQELLEIARSHAKNGIFSHSFLLVDYKLLALYSSRNSELLPKKCILLLIILTKCLFSSKTTHEIEHAQNVPNDINQKQHSFFILLPSSKNDLVPYIVYILPISSKINLVFLCELVKKTSLSKHLMFLVNKLDSILNSSKNKPPLGCSFLTLETSFQNLIASLEKLKCPEYIVYSKSLITKWEQMKQLGFSNLCQNSKKPIDSRLESIIQSMNELCRIIFGEVILKPAVKLESTSDYDTIFNEIRKISLRRLRDCISYLEAKAEQNVTMSSYINEYPGLIHFIYVDRNSDYMIAPSVVLTEGHLKGTASLKNKVWKMVTFGRKYVNGSNSYLCTWQHNDLKYLYSIWFENSDGKLIKPTKHIENLPDKEIICGNFFRDMVEKCFPNASYSHIYCYELFCIHLMTVNSSDIIEQSRQLGAKLWALSGAYRVLDLL